jgi:hypothetical protein
MPKSIDVVAGNQAFASEVNNIREDAIRLLANSIQTRTLSSDAFTLVDGKARYELTSQSGTTDDLSTLTADTGVPDDGDIVIVYPASGHTITIKHNVGNIWVASEDDVTMEAFQYTMLTYDEGDTKWYITGGAGAGDDFLVTQVFS